MGTIGQKQRQQLNNNVGGITSSGGSVSLGGVPMDSGADVARGLEGSMGSNMSEEQAQNILDRIRTVSNMIEVFAECRRNPLCIPKPEYTTCDISIDEGGLVQEDWR